MNLLEPQTVGEEGQNVDMWWWRWFTDCLPGRLRAIPTRSWPNRRLPPPAAGDGPAASPLHHRDRLLCLSTYLSHPFSEAAVTSNIQTF